MSTTESDLTSSDNDDALGEMFASEEFDTSLDEALDDAELELDLEPGDTGAVTDDAATDPAPTDVAAEDEADPDVSDVVVIDEADPDHAVDDEEHRDAAAPHDTDVDEVDGDETDGDETDGDGAPSSAAGDVLPDVVPATPDRDTDGGIAAHDGVVADPDLDSETDVDDEPDDEEVSDRILEELRRADIDGPVVPLAPQDDTTAVRRRPRRAADYDPAPVPIPAKVPRVLGRKPRVRKVTRVVRHVDPWSVFKIALVAHLVLYVMVLTASVLLWNVAYSTNTIDNVERFFESFGWNSFEFNGGELYHAGWIAGLFVVIGLTGLAVLSATLFNLITDLVGGVRFTVLEEEVVETRTSPMRRFVVRRSEPEVPAVLRDGSGTMVREALVDDASANDRPTR